VVAVLPRSREVSVTSRHMDGIVREHDVPMQALSAFAE
jgi:hypothetical protein